MKSIGDAMLKKPLQILFFILGVMGQIIATPLIQSDSLCLIRIKALNPNSTISWDTSKPAKEWDGVSLNYHSTLGEYYVRHLFLSNMKIDTLPEDLNFLDLKSLHLKGNNLKVLPSNKSLYDSLETLDVRANLLTSINSNVSVDNYGEIYLSNNRLTSIPASLFDKNISDWDLSNNLIENLDESFFQGNLSSLNVSNNRLKSLPSTIGNCKNLSTLNLYNNEISLLPPEIGECEKLASINISSNFLTTIPPEISNLSSLSSLNLSNNNINSIPNEFGNLRMLKVLRLDRNSLPNLPEGIGTIPNLNELSLQNNYLESVPSTLGGLTFLNKLYMQNNKLITLPKEIGDLSHLDELYVGNNLITSIPSEISKLEKLSMLDISRNKLTKLPEAIIAISPGKGGIVIDSNYISPDSIDNTVLLWLNANAPDWLSKQHNNTMVVKADYTSQSKSIHLMISENQLILNRKPQNPIAITISDLTGRTLFKKADITRQRVDLPSLSPGVFVYRIKEGATVSYNKISILK